MGAQQRLIVCLDGTWNKQDNSTNVLHHFNLVYEGAVPGTEVIQRKFYHPGVGTKELDRLTGGGFGFGLEQNVRDAYNWLVGNYHDDCDPPDEIYVFGFSRGAYTARSLVGFISQCGLLRRGAPITVSQLWDDYCILGREKEVRTSLWERLLPPGKASIRPITKLVKDPWQGGELRSDPQNLSETLLVQWSRRVRITYLGIYDTVGAIGWDALAIPGLTSRIALHNNMRPTTLIQHCRHALAIDENRSSFNHTPFLAFIGDDLDEVKRGTGESLDDAKLYWEKTAAMWRRRITQRWFVGAHSNIGGGYEDNLLAERPLQWVLEGATALHLVQESMPVNPPQTLAGQIPRDSYKEFAWPLWTQIIRNKRNYRAIDPEPVPRASGSGEPRAGFTLATICEEVDQTVVDYWGASKNPLPPNLDEYASRTKCPILGARSAAHQWLSGWADYLTLVFWATLAAAGLRTVDLATGLIPAGARLGVTCVVAFLLPLVDWAESAFNFKCALGRGGPRARAVRDAIYWTRMLGFVLMVFGAVYSILELPHLGWSREFDLSKEFGATYWPVPVCAAVAALLAGRSKAALAGSLAGAAATALVGTIMVGLGGLASALLPEVVVGSWTPLPPYGGHSVPGLLLLLQLTLIYFWRAWVWNGDPMNEARLGSIAALQVCLTPKQVIGRTEHWRQLLECPWRSEDPVDGPAAKRMREVVGESLWRDIVGFIPVYSMLFLLALWFGASDLPRFDFLNWPGDSLALWWMLPAAAAATDYVEDACHLRYVRLHSVKGAPPAALTAFSWLMSEVKYVAFSASAILTLWILGTATLAAGADLTDWRAKIAVATSVLGTLTFLFYILAESIHFIRSRARRRVRERAATA